MESVQQPAMDDTTGLIDQLRGTGSSINIDNHSSGQEVLCFYVT
jgi:hypothetical protein